MMSNTLRNSEGFEVNVTLSQLISWETLSIHFEEEDIRLLHIFRQNLFSQKLVDRAWASATFTHSRRSQDNYVHTCINSVPRDQQRALFRVLNEVDRKTNLLVQSYEALHTQAEDEVLCLQDIVQRIMEWWNVTALAVRVLTQDPTDEKTFSCFVDRGGRDTGIRRRIERCYKVPHKVLLALDLSILTLGRALLTILNDLSQISLGANTVVDNPSSPLYVTACRAHTYSDIDLYYISTYEYQFPENMSQLIDLVKHMRMILSESLRASDILTFSNGSYLLYPNVVS